MSADEYQAGSRRLSPAKRAREMRRIEQERKREAQRGRERPEQEAQAQRALAVRQALDGLPALTASSAGWLVLRPLRRRR